MPIGQLRHQATIEQLSEQRSDFTGEPLREWEEVARMRIGFDKPKDMIVEDNDQLHRIGVTKAYMRYPGFDLLPNTMRIKARGRTYNIVDVSEVNAQRRWVELLLRAGDGEAN